MMLNENFRLLLELLEFKQAAHRCFSSAFEAKLR